MTTVFFGLEVLLQGNATPAPSVASWSPTSVAVGSLVDAFAVVQLVLYSGIAVVHDLGSSRDSAHCCSRTVWSAGDHDGAIRGEGIRFRLSLVSSCGLKASSVQP